MVVSSFTLRLAVEKPIAFQSYSGFSSCGLFYDLVRSVDPSLAEELHSSKKLAPWSVTPIYRELPPPRSIAYKLLSAPSIASVTFTTFNDSLAEILKRAVLEREDQIKLGKVKARILEVAVNIKKFSDFAAGDPLPEKFAIKFITPTALRRSISNCYFARSIYTSSAQGTRKGNVPYNYVNIKAAGGILVPLPVPSLIFRNLAKIWLLFSDFRIDAWSAARWAENAILVAGFPKGLKSIKIYEHPTTEKWAVGFIGTVRFSIKEEMYREKYARMAAALLRLAEHSNVGIRRTAGLGLVKLIMKPPQAAD